MLDEALRKRAPRIPHILRDLKSVQFATEKTVSVKPEIAKLFPKTSHSSAVRAKVEGCRPLKPLRIGALFSGGQAAGGHNVIAGLFDALGGGSLIGFLDGPQGVVKGESKEITASLIDAYRNQGGFDLLGSGREKIETEADLQACLAVVKRLALDGLVIIGGDDSNTNTAVLAEYFLKEGCLARVIGIPKTIDGDLQNTYVPISFGFDTATKIYSELIGNLARDALSDKKYTHFIKLMGRSASHIALECALSTQPNLTLIGEERKTLPEVVSEIADLVIRRAERGKNYGVILIPEGIVEFIPDLQKEVPDLARDAHGNINVSAIETDLFLLQKTAAELARRNFSGRFTPVRHFFGYEGRAGFPSPFDADYTYALGLTAALLIAQKFTGMMAFVDNLKSPAEEWRVGGVPITSFLHLEERKGKIKPVIAKTFVDLKGKPYQIYQQNKNKWAIEDCYLFPGPIQFFGDKKITDTIPKLVLFS